MTDRPTTHRVVLSLGSNVGERLENLQGAVDTLFDAPGIRPVALSPVYETAPVGGPTQGPFLNAVVVADTALDPDTLLERVQSVEEAFGRVRHVRWGPRSLDIDIIVCGGEKRDDERLTLPHPRAYERAFVLRPWVDVDPAAELPDRGVVRELLRTLTDQRIDRRDDLTLQGPD